VARGGLINHGLPIHAVFMRFGQVQPLAARVIPAVHLERFAMAAAVLLVGDCPVHVTGVRSEWRPA